MNSNQDKFSSISSLRQGHIFSIPLEDGFDDSDDDMVPPDLTDNPCLNSFIKFRDENMKPLYLDKIYKRILKEGYGMKPDPEEYKIQYEYELYLEGQVLPFDSHKLTKRFGVIDERNGRGVLPGLMESICSMEYKEAAIFWISHEMMYGALGMIDKIPPKSDIVATLKIARIFDKYDNEIKPQPDIFTSTMSQVRKNYAKGYDEFKNKNFHEAILVYKKAVHMLTNLRLANDAQEMEVKESLIKFYENLAICYNNIKWPQRACLAFQELERLVSIKDNAKMLYTKGKALIMLNELNRAEKLLRQGMKIKPNTRFDEALKEIETMRYEQKRYAQTQQANFNPTNDQDDLNLARYFTSMELAGDEVECPPVQELYQNYTPPNLKNDHCSRGRRINNHGRGQGNYVNDDHRGEFFINAQSNANQAQGGNDHCAGPCCREEDRSNEYGTHGDDNYVAARPHREEDDQGSRWNQHHTPGGDTHAAANNNHEYGNTGRLSENVAYDDNRRPQNIERAHNVNDLRTQNRKNYNRGPRQRLEIPRDEMRDMNLPSSIQEPFKSDFKNLNQPPKKKSSSNGPNVGNYGKYGRLLSPGEHIRRFNSPLPHIKPRILPKQQKENVKASSVSPEENQQNIKNGTDKKKAQDQTPPGPNENLIRVYKEVLGIDKPFRRPFP